MTIDEAIDCVLIEAVLTGVITDVEAAAADLRTIFAHNGGWIIHKPYDYSIRRTKQYYKWEGQERMLQSEGYLLGTLVGYVMAVASVISRVQSTPVGLVISWTPQCE
jgi:hypothetical protein